MRRRRPRLPRTRRRRAPSSTERRQLPMTTTATAMAAEAAAASYGRRCQLGPISRRSWRSTCTACWRRRTPAAVLRSYWRKASRSNSGAAVSWSPWMALPNSASRQATGRVFSMRGARLYAGDETAAREAFAAAVSFGRWSDAVQDPDTHFVVCTMWDTVAGLLDPSAGACTLQLGIRTTVTQIRRTTRLRRTILPDSR